MFDASGAIIAYVLQLKDLTSNAATTNSKVWVTELKCVMDWTPYGSQAGYFDFTGPSGTVGVYYDGINCSGNAYATALTIDCLSLPRSLGGGSPSLAYGRLRQPLNVVPSFAARSKYSTGTELTYCQNGPSTVYAGCHNLSEFCNVTSPQTQSGWPVDFETEATYTFPVIAKIGISGM